MLKRKPKRSFKVIDINNLPGKEKTYYKSTSAAGAASKMASLFFRVTGQKRATVNLEEITKGGSGKKSTYVVKRVRSQSDWKPEGDRPKPKYQNVVRSGSKVSLLERKPGWHAG